MANSEEAKEDTHVITSRRLVLGLFNSLSPDGQFASIMPIAWSHEDAGWHKVENGAKEYPNKGEVSWKIRPQDQSIALLGRPCVFHVELKSGFDASRPGRDKYQAQDVKPVSEVLCPDGGPHDEETTRLILLGGIHLKFAPAIHTFVKVSGARIIGPLTFEQDTPGTWRMQLDDHRAEVHVFQAPAAGEAFEFSKRGVQRTFLLEPPAAPIQWVDWSSDRLVIKRLLEAIKTLDPRAKEKAEWVQKSLKSSSDAIAQFGDAKEQELTRYRIKRAHAILGKAGTNADFINSSLEDLKGLPGVAAALNRLEARVSEEARTAVETALRERKAELASLESQIKNCHRTLSELAQQLEEKKNEQLREFQVAGEELDRMIDSLIEKPSKLIATSALLQALFRQQQPTPHNRDTTPNLPSDHRPSLREEPVLELKPYDSEENFLAQARGLLAAQGIHRGPAVVRTIQATLLSRRIPLVAGEAGIRALDAFARALTGLPPICVQVSATLCHYGELLGSISPNGATFTPHPSGLPDLICLAQDKSSLRVVLLEGVNRSAVDATLFPLLRHYSRVGSGTEGTLRPFPIIQKASFEPYQHLVEFSWPENVLLVASLAEGPTALPFPKDSWYFFSFIPLSIGEASASKASANGQVPHALWKSWQAAIKGSGGPKSSESIKGAPFCEDSLAMDVHHTSQDFQHHLTRLLDSAETAGEFLVASVLMPLSAGDEQLRKQVLSQLPQSLKKSPAIEQSQAAWKS